MNWNHPYMSSFSNPDIGVSMAAAAASVDDMLLELVRNGMDIEKAKAVTSAAQQFLVRAPGYDTRARSILSKAGFSGEEAGDILTNLRQVIVEAQPA